MSMSHQGERWKAAGGWSREQSRCARISFPIPHSPFLTLHSSFPPRRGVTLVELLITMTIMAIIAAAVLGTAAAAIESGREKKTQSTIAKIHSLLMERYASYETRRIDVDPRITRAIDAWVAQAATPADFQARSTARGQMLADARLLGLRELMKKEMPDRGEDVNHVVQVLSQPPPLAQIYFRRAQQLPSGATLSSAECLYMVVMSATGDGEARTLFTKQDIGDTDDDGAPEFIDGWGNPISWMRWPAGVVSDLQPLSADGTRPGIVDHDPFDLFRRDSPTVSTPSTSVYPSVAINGVQFVETYRKNLRNRIEEAAADPTKTYLTAYRLVPLIYSVGPDGEPGMQIPKNSDAAPLDPYLVTSDGYQAGAIDRDNPDIVKDNITNHLLEY
jgi:prepilin-type N-terminal cleavage/methylation domain-containing protein